MSTLPTWLYHKKHEAKVFETAEAVEKAKAEGWVDTPAKFEAQNEDNGQETQPSGDQKPTETKPEQTPGEDKGGAEAKPITKENYIKWSLKKLKEFLVAAGVDEKSLKGLEKDELIAKIGELGK